MKLKELLEVACFGERLRVYDSSNYCFLQTKKHTEDKNFNTFAETFKDCEILYIKPEYDGGYLYLTIRIGCEIEVNKQ